MKVKDILKKVYEIEKLHGGEYDILALDCEGNTYDFKDIIFHDGLEVFGVEFE